MGLRDSCLHLDTHFKGTRVSAALSILRPTSLLGRQRVEKGPRGRDLSWEWASLLVCIFSKRLRWQPPQDLRALSLEATGSGSPFQVTPGLCQ